MGKANRSDIAFVSFRFILFTTLMIYIENTVATDTLAQSQKLSVGQTLVSSDQTFELGFFQPGNSSKRFIGIWYKNIAWSKSIWVMNRENPLDMSDTGPILTIASDGNLKLLDGTRKTVWSTNVSSSDPNNTIAVISEKGEFSLQDNVTGTIFWKSFDSPSDSFIAGMRLGLNNRTGEKYVLNSWRANDDPSRGDFVLGFTTDSPPQNIMWKNSRPHWRSGPWDGWRFIGLYQRNRITTSYSNGFMVQQDNAGSVYASYKPPSTSQSQVMIEVLTSEGNLEVMRWDIGTEEGGVKWKAIEVFCDVYGSCGPFGVCNRPKATCECLRGFYPNSEQEWSKGNWTRGCRRRTELACAKSTSTTLSKTDSDDGFARLKNMKAPDHYSYLFNVNVSDCKQRCSSNCMCVAYAFVDGIGCLTWAGELLDV